MNMSIRWREVIPWSALVIVLSCGGATIAPATTPAGPVKSLEVEEIVLRGKDGQVRGKLTGESLSLSDAAGNKLDISLGESSNVSLTSPTGVVAMLAIDKDVSTMSLSAGGRSLAAGVETHRPLADLEVFDADNKRRASFGLNSNGDPRVSLYDANETRRMYGILIDDVTILDLNDKSGAAAVELFGADGTRGSGMSVTHDAKTTSVGVGVDGKPLR
jgi:hypothetical protein